MSSAGETFRAVFSSQRARDEDLASAHRTLATLCRAGVPLGAALTAVDAATETPQIRDALAAVARDVEAGATLHDAYARHGRPLPPFHAALLRSGHASGDVPTALDACADYAELTARVNGRLRRATAYPVLAAGFTLSIGVGLLVVVGPRMAALQAEIVPLAGLSARLPTSSAPFIAPGGMLFAPAAALALLGLAAVLALTIARLRRPLEGGAARRLMMRLPVIGRLRLLRALTTHASALAALLDRQLPLPEALSLAAAAVGDAEVRTRAHAAAASAEGGAGLADALQTNGLLAPSLGWLVASAEEMGNAPDALRDVARIHADRLDRASERLARVVTPALEIVVGLTVFALAYSFVVPLFEMSTRLLGVF